jgi:hypothetical protein
VIIFRCEYVKLQLSWNVNYFKDLEPFFPNWYLEKVHTDLFCKVMSNSSNLRAKGNISRHVVCSYYGRTLSAQNC